MIPKVLFRGAIPNIKVQKISNYDQKEPLGPGIYATSSLDTVEYYTSRGRSVYKLVVDSNYLHREHCIIELSSKLNEQAESIQDKLKVVLNEHYDFLELDESRNVVDLLFNREYEIQNYNFECKIAHKERFKGSLLSIPHFFAKAFFEFLKPKVCKAPLPKVAPRDEDIVNSLISIGIWMGIGSIENDPYTDNGKMDAGIQYLFYDEKAITNNLELTKGN
ncbi:hypothetical protein [Thalassotalea atypica]|uniref:hypothetical protein n=1 Tax=Thalassotalea atypica TaxID=2054316 RepID=UPI0025738034|nr:hypothetical protein [Thalassotalea atypica]